MNRQRFGVALLLLTMALGASAQTVDGRAADDFYQLGTGDKIRIQVFGEDDLTLEIGVSDSGVVSYPFIGEVQVAGRTPNELEALIKDGLSPDYLIDPDVNVNVLEYRPFFVSGEVKEPGGYPFQPGLTVEKAIALAGGFTERASRSRIFVVHDDSPGERMAARLNTVLRPGDSLTVEQSFF